jgi:hypothetical protein
MVNHLFFLFLVLPLFLFSGEFIASVNRNQIKLGESVTLNLTLKETSPKGSPAIELLKKSFFINSQQQARNTVMINGQFTSSIIWKFVLIPQKEGEVIIPSISIDTSEGLLSSAPLTIQVIKGGGASDVDSSDIAGVTLTTNVSNLKPYKNESIFYTVRLISKRNLANIKMQKINVEDAIVETNDEPKVYETIVDGINVGVIEFSYLITPLKAGSLKIPSTVIQGDLLIRRNTHAGSFFDDDFDPFALMQGFSRSKPFALTSEEVVVDVQPALADVIPWLPAKSLKIEESWNETQPLQVGEPLTRVFKIVAEGIKASQLPNLSDLQIHDDLFKIYADKPELGEEVKEGNINSYRKEEYTLIPQQAGNLTLPEISIAWWDVAKKEKVITRIPARTLHILPGPENTGKSQMPAILETDHSPSETQSIVIQRDPLLYVLIAGLMIVLIVAIFWGMMLQKKIMQLTKDAVDLKSTHTQHEHLYAQDGEDKSAKGAKREKLPDLNPT